MKIQILSAVKIGNKIINSTEELARLVTKKGKENICSYLPYMKCLPLKTDLDTETGVISWATQDGDLISENGYHYNINCFIN